MTTTALDTESPAKDYGTYSSRGSDPRCVGCVCLFVCGVKGLGQLMMFPCVFYICLSVQPSPVLLCVWLGDGVLLLVFTKRSPGLTWAPVSSFPCCSLQYIWVSISHICLIILITNCNNTNKCIVGLASCQLPCIVSNHNVGCSYKM